MRLTSWVFAVLMFTFELDATLQTDVLTYLKTNKWARKTGGKYLAKEVNIYN